MSLRRYIPVRFWEEHDFFDLSPERYERAKKVWALVQTEKEQGRLTLIDFFDVVEAEKAQEMADALAQPCVKKKPGVITLAFRYLRRVCEVTA